MRAWNELVAGVADLVPGGVPMIVLILMLVTALTALLWYWWPRWLPRAGGAGSRRRRGGRFRWRRPSWPRLRLRLRPRWPRLRTLRWSRWRLRWRRRHRPVPDEVAAPPADELPDLPAGALVLSADELAAQGRYREAVRERLRAIVRDLVEREILEHRPGWTVTELAGAAGHARPATAPPLGAASDVFSRIWYGRHAAQPGDDAAMRQYAGEVRAALDDPPVRV